MDVLFKLLGLVTRKEFEMLKDDLREQLSGLSSDVDALGVRLGGLEVALEAARAEAQEARANAVEQEDLDLVVALRAKVNDLA